MENQDIKEIAVKMAKKMPVNANGADRADIFVALAIELGLSHLLLPEALPSDMQFSDLPRSAPELYRDRTYKSEKPHEFIERVYTQWLGKGLARHHILHLDEALYMALSNWLKKNDLPEDFDLPTKKQLNDRELERLGLRDGDTLPYPSYYTGLKDKLRLYNAARNRQNQ